MFNLILKGILKGFNKEIYGYSTGAGNWSSANAKFNLAIPSSTS
jgi:hypothetical protein